MIDEATSRPRLPSIVLTGWMIEDARVDQYWSNSEGWVDWIDGYVFTDKEKRVLNLPFGGQWVSLREIFERRVEAMRNHAE
jgi:hypothetical protein